MKLVMVIVNDEVITGLTEKLLQKGFRITRLPSTGGFLRRGNTTLMSAVEDDDVQVLIQTIKAYIEKKKLEQLDEPNGQVNLNQGMATLFVLSLDKMLHI